MIMMALHTGRRRRPWLFASAALLLAAGVAMALW